MGKAVNGKGIITCIQRFSLNDGPGIRTTVFFKGCNLRCAWCHNPETIGKKSVLFFSPEKCIMCLNCVKECPHGAHKAESGRHVFDRTLCVNCGKCASICYPGALELAGRSVTVDEVMKEVLQDKAYYLDSGGGVTLSGGEAVLQPEFMEALVDACHDAGIECALETNLAYDFGKVGKILKKFDLVMFDLKLWSDKEHRRWTGAGNTQILENACRLDQLGIPLIARTPLIPGVTDSEENIAGIAEFLAERKNVRHWEMLNFNPLGGSKYEALGVKNSFAGCRPLEKAILGKWKSYASSCFRRVQLA